MKSKFTVFFIGLVLSTAGFAAGRLVQHNKSGYHYEVRDTKYYDTSVGSIRWSCVTESVGMPFLDAGTTVLELDGRTIYKARRSFQESSPCAGDITVTPGGITWNDGDFRFDLEIHRMTVGDQALQGNPR